ncbi:MAG: flavin reductase family protein [Chloroflexi bacterium]|nr:flavin reductase family protein [Chloroflexota bacterium]
MLKEVELSRAYRTTPTGLYLFSTSRDGKRNVQFAFRALGVWDDPPLLLVGVMHTNYSLEVIQETREFVLNVCSQEQVRAIGASRGLSGRTVEDKFAVLGLDTRPAQHVQAPLVAGCHANVECRVANIMEAGGVTLFLAEALACYVDEDRPPVARLSGKTYLLQGPVD